MSTAGCSGVPQACHWFLWKKALFLSEKIQQLQAEGKRHGEECREHTGTGTGSKQLNYSERRSRPRFPVCVCTQSTRPEVSGGRLPAVPIPGSQRPSWEAGGTVETPLCWESRALGSGTVSATGQLGPLASRHPSLSLSFPICKEE